MDDDGRDVARNISTPVKIGARIEDHIVTLTDTMMCIILDAMSIPNLWTKPTDVETLRGNLGTTLRFSGIPELKQNSDAIVSELIKLAKSNESVLRNLKNNNENR